jgi:hypothetical protein
MQKRFGHRKNSQNTKSTILFFLQFQHPSTKQIVSFHALYIFKTMHTNSPSYFHIFKDTKKKEISLFTYASYQHTNFFQMQFKYQISLINVPIFMATFTPNAPLH